MTKEVYLGFGGNVGEVESTFSSALLSLSRHIGPLLKISSLYTSPALKIPTNPLFTQPDYLNGAALFYTELSAQEVLRILHDEEKAHGRDREKELRWGPRTLDLDLLFFDNQCYRSEHLTIPHPRLHERPFVLKPLTEIAPHKIHPLLGASIKELLENINDSECTKSKEAFLKI
jgi:2-amino-4-hydroxy-6-hydroxymethyldihydropteridine diphosphokinase